MPAFDPKIHKLDPVSGFQLDKETGHIAGLMSAPVSAKKEPSEYPKWVEPHVSHIVRDGAHVSAPLFPMVFEDRDGKVLVMVHDEKEEAMAKAPMVLPSNEKTGEH